MSKIKSIKAVRRARRKLAAVRVRQFHLERDRSKDERRIRNALAKILRQRRILERRKDKVAPPRLTPAIVERLFGRSGAD